MDICNKYFNQFYKIILLIASVLFITPGLQATNLKFQNVKLPEYTINTGNLEINFKVANDNVLPAEYYKVKFEFFNKQTNQLLYSDEVNGLNLKPFTDTAFAYYLAWNYGYGMVKIKMTIDFAEDINLNDNVYNGEFKSYASRTQAAEAADDYLKEKYSLSYKPNLSYLSMSYDLFPSGSKISSSGNDLNITLNDNKWLGWVNYDKYSKLEGNNGIVLVDPLTLKVDYYGTKWWPKFTSQIEYDIFDTTAIVSGSSELKAIEHSGSTVTDSTTPSKPAKACVILVSGVDTESRAMEESFNNDLDVMKKNLMLESFGPKLQEADITVLKNADSAKVRQELMKLKDKCTDVYFYYTGHGSRYGFMSLGNSIGMPYWTLFEELYGSGAENIHVLIDACYSGKALEYAKADPRFAERNIEVIASSDSGKTSWTNRVKTDVYGITYSAYTWYFVICFGQPDADQDKDGKTSFAEAAEWVLKQNPELSGGGKLVETQNPQILTNTKKPVVRTRDEVAQAVKENIYYYYPEYDTSKSVIYLEMDTTKAGTLIKSFDGDYYDYLDTTKYLGWIDWEKDAGFSHKTTYLMIDPYQPDSIKLIENDWWPVIGDSTKYKPFDDKKIVLGTQYKLYPSTDTLEFTFATDSAVAADTCVLIVSGPDERKLIQDAMRNGAQNMKLLLSKNYLGPKIPESKITVLNEPTVAGLNAALNALKGKCLKIYFYYVGHGTNDGQFQLKDGFMNYGGLFGKLFDADAGSYSVFIDCCYSGLARDAMENDPRYPSKDVELVTSSNNKKVSWYNGISAGNDVMYYALYTRQFAISSVDKNADADNDGIVSWNEAFDWTVARNPVNESGKKIDTLMRPTYTANRISKSTGTQPIDFTDEGLKIIPNGTGANNAEFRLRLNYGEFDTYKLLQDIRYISPVRYWNLEINPQDTKFNVDLEFYPDEKIDSVFGKPGSRIGIVTRKGISQPWAPYYPSVWDSSMKIITGKGVTSFSDWALALLDPDPDDVEEEKGNPYGSIKVFVYPNPLINYCNIKVELSDASDIRLELTDTRGSLIEVIGDGFYTAGVYSFIADTDSLAPGVYFLKLTAGNDINVMKLIKTE